MPQRTEICVDCGAFKTFPDGDWKAVQSLAVRAWEVQHASDAHDGKEVSGWELEPYPLRDHG